MDFPAYDILLVSQHDDEPGIADDFSQGGIQHSRTFHDEVYSRFTVVWDMTWAQYKSIRAVYDADPRASYTNFMFYNVSPAEKYTVKFLGRPQITENHGDGQYSVRVIIRGTLD